MALQAMPHRQGNRNSHRLVMPPDTVSMEKRELSILHHPMTNCLQRYLKKKHQQSPNQRDFSVHQDTPVCLPHTRGGISSNTTGSFVRGDGYARRPRALATTRRTCHELITDAAARDRPARARARAGARGSKRDEEEEEEEGGTCMMSGDISGSGSEMSTETAILGTSAADRAAVIAFASTPPPPPPWPLLPAAPFQARPSDPISPRGHALSPSDLVSLRYSWLGAKTGQDTGSGTRATDLIRSEATQARGA